MSVEQRRGNPRPTGRPESRQEPPKGRIYVAIDTESTGVEADSGEIIEVAVVKFRLEPGGVTRVLDQWQTYVKPKNPIPYKITHLTGIRQSDVQNAPPFARIEERLRGFLGNFPIVGHSIESDIRFLARHNFEVKNPAIDTYELATLMLPQMGNYSLVGVAAALNVKEAESHRAMADTLMAMHVFAGLAGKIEELPPEVLKEVNRIAGDLPGWPLMQVFTDAAANQRRQEEQQGSGAFGNLGAKLKQQLAEKTGRNESDDFDFMFLMPQERPEPLRPNPNPPELPFAKYGPRVENMAHVVNEAFEVGQHLLLEAPGNERDRALGLLLPAVNKAIEQGRNVVIAVNNETQRERLIDRLIPELQQTLLVAESGGRRERKRRGEEKLPFTAATIKPQNNYLCLRRWELFRKTAALTADERKMLIKLLIWLPNTGTGDSAELRIMNQERFWSRVNSQQGLCPTEYCDHIGPCFSSRARERAEGAHIIIADQALILADLLGQAGTLPEYDYLIIDEAHHFEDEAGRQFGTVVTPNTLFDLLDAISRPITWQPGGGHNGFVHNLGRYFSKYTSQPVQELLEKFREEITAQVELARNATGVMLQELTAALVQRNQETGQGDGRIRLDAKFRAGNLWNELAGPWESFKLNWEDLYYLLRDLRDECAALERQLSQSDLLKIDLDYYVNQADKLLKNLTHAFEGGNPDKVYWIAAHPRTELVSIFSQPLQVGPALSKHLFEKKKSVVLVSSTLTTDGDFTFIKDRLGLNNHETREVRMPPERDYSGMLLYLPTDMPEPNQPNYQKNVDHFVMELARNSQGRALVLFSSNSALRLSYRAVQRPLEAENILVLGQGLDGTRRSIMERFKNTSRALLLSTLNYWEANDFNQDDNLDNAALFDTLAITKLPFDAPSDPLFAARSESRLFDDPFVQYSLPRTILRFRQAFERMLSGLQTPGVVVMLDSRLTRKTYGPLFLNSLPPLPVRRDTLSQLIPQSSEWLQGKNNPIS
jgi:DNA polymerase-3 subunit epsilon/ATP-dependent DNA helicase DinG